MKSTCLCHFYEYIFKNWVQPQKAMPDFETYFQNNGFQTDNSEIHALFERKKYIWENTSLILQEAAQGQRDKLHQLIEQPGICHLCFVCRNCEVEYWRELGGYLFNNGDKQDLTKMDFSVSEEIKELLKQKQRPVDVYLDHYKRRISQTGNILVMLKGFSSSTPILLNYAQNTNFYSGGGFYIRWNGTGIAVDPGYLFIQNLHGYG